MSVECYERTTCTAHEFSVSIPCPESCSTSGAPSNVDAPLSVVKRSTPLLEALNHMDDNGQFVFVAPTGFLVSWVECVAWLTQAGSSSEREPQPEKLDAFLRAADFMIDVESQEKVCQALGRALFWKPEQPAPPEAVTAAIQVLEALPEHLATLVLKASPHCLDLQLAHFPPHLQATAVATAFPAVPSSMLQLHAGRHSLRSCASILWCMDCSGVSVQLPDMRLCINTGPSGSMPDEGSPLIAFRRGLEEFCGRGVQHVAVSVAQRSGDYSCESRIPLDEQIWLGYVLKAMKRPAQLLTLRLPLWLQFPGVFEKLAGTLSGATALQELHLEAHVIPNSVIYSLLPGIAGAQSLRTLSLRTRGEGTNKFIHALGPVLCQLPRLQSVHWCTKVDATCEWPHSALGCLAGVPLHLRVEGEEPARRGPWPRPPWAATLHAMSNLRTLQLNPRRWILEEDDVSRLAGVLPDLQSLECLHVRLYPECTNCPHLLQRLATLPAMTRLEYEGPIGGSQAQCCRALIDPLARMPALRHLKLLLMDLPEPAEDADDVVDWFEPRERHCSTATAMTSGRLPACAPALTSLHLAGAALRTHWPVVHALIASQCHSTCLQRLVVHNVHLCQPRGRPLLTTLATTIADAPSLKELELARDASWEEVDMQQLAVAVRSRLASLTRVAVSWFPPSVFVVPPDVLAAPVAARLQELHVCNVAVLWEEACALGDLFMHLSQLHTLRIESCTLEPREMLEIVASVSRLSSLQSLSVVAQTLRSERHSQDFVLARRVGQCPQLSSLDMDRTRVRDVAWKELTRVLERLPRLQRLRMPGTSDPKACISDRTRLSYAEQWRRMRELLARRPGLREVLLETTFFPDYGPAPDLRPDAELCEAISETVRALSSDDPTRCPALRQFAAAARLW